MKISLSLRLFLVHLGYTLAFTAVAGVITVRIVQDGYREYSQNVQEQIATLGVETELMPMAEEVALSLLRASSGEFPEVNEQRRREISAGLQVVLRGMPIVRSFLILDQEKRIQYATPPDKALDLILLGTADQEFLSKEIQTRRQVVEPGGEPATQIMVPIREENHRIGTLLITLAPDQDLMARRPSLEPPKVVMKNITVPAIVFLVLIGLGSLTVAAISGQSVRGLDRALEDFRKRGFEGGLQAGKLARTAELAGTVRAISEMGGKLEKLSRQGKEREALLGTLSASLEDAMIALGPDGSPIAWNQAACRLAGDGATDEHEAIRKILDCNPWWVEGRGGGSRKVQHEEEVKLPQGNSIPAKLTRVPIEVQPGETGELLLIRDLAMLRKVEAHLLEAGRYAVLAHLAAGMAHEIRNPLHSIGLNAEVVEQYLEKDRDVPGRQAIEESLKSIQEETRRLTDLLNNYLGLVRPTSGVEPVNLRELCRRVIRLLGYTATQAGIELELVGEETLPVMEGDAERLQQAILNLVLNALQAMPTGGRISLETSTCDGAVVLQVADTGPGVPDDMEERLFDVNVTSKAEGAGLGLPLVRLIAEAHGGSITYAGGNDGGARFTLVLPSTGGDPS